MTTSALHIQRSGSLLEADAEALVNPVNTVGVMGQGLALQFMHRFPEMFEDYQNACQKGLLTPGRMHTYETGFPRNPRFIINFPTKRHWREPSRIEDVESGLRALADEICVRGIKSIAVPALGCGNGGLEWQQVLPLIQSYLGHLTDVEFIVFPPKGPN